MTMADMENENQLDWERIARMLKIQGILLILCGILLVVCGVLRIYSGFMA